MTKRKEFEPLDPYPTWFVNSQQELISGAAFNFQVRIKPSDATVLQVPAGAGDAQAGIVIGGTWRYVAATVERASIGGAARTLDLFVTASNDAITPGSPAPSDGTVYAFALALVEHDASPAGVDRSRKVAEVAWDGSKFTSVSPVVGGAPVVGLDVSLLVPPGVFWPYGGSSAPAGFLLCNGAAVSRGTYSALFAAIGTAYGAGDGTSTFNVPDLRGRVPVGVDGTAGRLSANDALGNSGGEEKHALTGAENGPHVHTTSIGNAFGGPGSVGTLAMHETNSGGTDIQSTSSGSGTPHNNMPPYQVANWIVKT